MGDTLLINKDNLFKAKEYAHKVGNWQTLCCKK